MKILVITYSFEVNPGTFLQAYGVQLGLKKLYPNATIEFLKHKKHETGESTHINQNNNKSFEYLKSKILAIPRRIKYEYQYRKQFTFTDKSFDLFDYNENEFKECIEKYNLIVVGSDTILIRLKKNEDNYGLMWLRNINKPKILFAASAAPAKFDVTQKDKEVLSNSFNQFSYLGVRDDITLQLLENKIGNIKTQIVKQLDPTYIIKATQFKPTLQMKRFFKNKLKSQKVVLVNFSKGFKYLDKISKSLRENNFYIVSTHYNPLANKNLFYYSPFEWAAMFNFISFTVTDRFHDSVFSLKNDKIVFAIDWNPARYDSKKNQSKCSDLLNQYGVSEYHHFFEDERDANNLINLIINKYDDPNIISKIHYKNIEFENRVKDNLAKIKSCL